MTTGDEMKIQIDETDFKQLSPAVQRELLERFVGDSGVYNRRRRRAEPAKLDWRRPIDLSPEQAQRLVHGLSEDHRRRLALFTRKNGRVRMKEILALTGETDLRATSAFQRVVTRRLRRLIEDPERKAQLIAWDFDATRWDDDRITIVDGVYYVSEPTAAALRACLKPKGDKAD